MTICVSVVVPTYRRDALLGRCLAALTAQDFDPAAYEIIVVDDAASETTRRLVEGGRWRERLDWEAYGLRPVLPEHPGTGTEVLDDPADILLETRYGLRTTRHVTLPAGGQEQDEPVPAPAAGAWSDSHRTGLPVVRYIAITDEHGPAVARNHGWRAARGEVVAFIDDDCISVPGWLKAGVSAFGEGVLGVSGRILMPLAGVPTDYELNATGLERSEFVTANCFYRRSALAEAGGFDERFRIAWREDSDLFFTLLEMTGDGHQPGRSAFRYAPQAIVFHPIRPASWGVSLRQQRKNQFNALLYKKHPILYRQRLGAATPWHYYAIMGALFAAPVSLLADQTPAAAGALTVWLALTARFCRQRLRHTSRTPAHIVEMAVTSVMIPPLAVFWRLAGAIKYRVWFL